MGKSLSILSLIIKTLEDARDWASSQMPSETTVVEPNRASRATLIIVSSACESLSPNDFYSQPFANRGLVLSIDQRMVCRDTTVSFKIALQRQLVDCYPTNSNRHLDEETFATLKTVRWHGSSRKSMRGDLMEADIVITTYNTLAVEYKNRPSILHDIEWYRVVLDEGMSKSSIFFPQ